MNRWRYIRLPVVGLSALSAWYGPIGPHAAPPIGWVALGVIFAVSSLGWIPILAIQFVNPYSGKLWHKPSWDLNPFTFRDPLQFLHLAAYAMLAGATVTIIRFLTSGLLFYVELLVPLAMSVGLFIALSLVPRIFRSKFSIGA